MRVLQSCIFPVAMYVREAWTPLQSDIKRFVNNITCYRKLLQISWIQNVIKGFNITSSHLFFKH